MHKRSRRFSSHLPSPSPPKKVVSKALYQFPAAVSFDQHGDLLGCCVHTSGKWGRVAVVVCTHRAWQQTYLVLTCHLFEVNPHGSAAGI